MKKILSFLLLVNLIIFASIAAAQQNQPEPSGTIPQAASVPAPAEATVPAAESPEVKKMVTAIEVKGNKTISLATILSKIKTRVSQEYVQNIVSDDLKRLYNTGYFSDVRVDRQDFESGFKVIFLLDEKKLIEDVSFSKTRYISSKVLKTKIQTKLGRFLDTKVLKEDVEKIKDMYVKKGLTNAQVDVEQSVDEVTNKVSLHFIIEEGQKIRIKKINILGNNTFSDGVVMKQVKTRTKNWFRSGILKQETLDEDMERIASFYEQKGFIDATAVYSVDKMQKGWIQIDVKIDEGKRYVVSSLKIAGNKIISGKQIHTALKNTYEGGYFSRQKLSLDIADVRNLYFDQGYIFANIKDEAGIDSKLAKVDVTLNIDEGRLAYIEKVKIQGNSRTRDIVIRRELKLYPGDRFDGGKLRRSKERLTNLGYFDEVNFDMEDTSAPDRKNLLVDVKEAKTGSFSFGGGYSTVDKVVGFVEIEQRNFDFAKWPTFTGAGQQLTLRAEAGSTKNNLLLSFTEPWLFDHPVSAGFDLYRTVHSRDNSSGYIYDEERVGQVLRLGKQFSEYWSGGLSYKHEWVKIGNLEDNVSADLRAEEGHSQISMMGASIKRDSRDNVFSPTKGWVTDNGTDLAGGPFSGDKNFYRLKTDNSYYVPLKYGLVVELRGRGGYMDAYGNSDKVPIFERFFAGGARTIRGYDERSIGPIDSVTKDPIGGDSMLIGNIELTVPIVDFFKLAGFFDTGNVWASPGDIGKGGLKSGFGFGARVKTPIGPINLDYGFPLSAQPGDESKSKSGKFYFSVSRGF
ncbi:MAG: outer membrane protein assembly factor BamA [Candidatus Omnitrophica bacterium]|nr:outer membrane protein assembly factor BamA [Candidatus Omnitrophota bacterium]